MSKPDGTEPDSYPKEHRVLNANCLLNRPEVSSGDWCSCLPVKHKDGCDHITWYDGDCECGELKKANAKPNSTGHDPMCKCHPDHRDHYKNPACEQMPGCKDSTGPVAVEQIRKIKYGLIEGGTVLTIEHPDEVGCWEFSAGARQYVERELFTAGARVVELQAEVDQLREVGERLRDDLLERAKMHGDQDADGTVVVDVSSTIWILFNEALQGKSNKENNNG